MIYKFYDTCSLLLKGDKLFDEENARVVISSISLGELEEIKTASNKDADIKYSARKLLRLLDKKVGAYDVWIYKSKMIEPMVEKGFDYVNNDLRILATAFDYDYNVHPDETVFVTNDLALKNIANCFFGEDSIESVDEDDLDPYTGYKEITIADNRDLAFFYEHLNINHFGLYIN